MSQRRGRVEEFDIGDAIENLEAWYHVPVLLFLVGFMFWVRVRSWSNFVRNGEVFFNGNDPWYHYRTVQYTVAHYPQTMPFDPWTYFPHGTSSAQFGTLYDQLVATVALIVGLGHPDTKTVALTLLIAPAVIGALVAVPVYLMGKRVGGRFGGLVGVLALALSTGGFLQRSLVGFSDHQVAETFFHALAFLVLMVAVGVAQSERPVWELVVGREWTALRRPFGWSILAGVATALYIFVWPPGMVLIGIVGLFLLFQLSIDYLRGRSPDHVAFVGVVAMATTGLLTFLPLNEFTVAGTTNFTLTQPLLAFTVAATAAFMAWLARVFDARDVDRRAYPVAVLGSIAVVTGLAAVVLPNVYGIISHNAVRLLGLHAGAAARTVGEVQAFQNPLQTFVAHFGLAFVAAMFGLVAILASLVRDERPQGELLLLFVWTVILTLATLTQSRFEYYLVLPIAVLTAYDVHLIAEFIRPADGESGVETFQALVMVMVVFLVAAPMLMGLGGGTVLSSTQANTSNPGSANAPSSSVMGWQNSLQWMRQNTPEEGNWGGANNADKLDFLGTYPRQSDYDYPAGSYGVISWWDYGHWIETRAHRIPDANPFQQGATEAANFLLAPNETQAENVVQNNLSENDSTTRYVMVDALMVNPRYKFGAPVVFYDNANLSRDQFYHQLYVRGKGGYQPRFLKTQRYYESTMNRLWYFYGSSKQPTTRGGVYVINWDVRQLNGKNGPVTVRVQPTDNSTKFIKRFNNMSAARKFVEQDGSAQIGGIGGLPSEYVPALHHYRLVHMGAESVRTTSGVSPWVKTFERVPGATIQGTGPANENVTVRVPMKAYTRNQTFTYTARTQTGSDGSFDITVPYSTQGYDNWGPDSGHTNVSVRATGPYRISTGFQSNESGAIYTYSASANVSEAKVIGEDDSPVTVSLNRTVIANPGNRTNGTDSTGNATSPTPGSGNSTTGSNTSGNSTGTASNTGSANGSSTQPAMAAPERTAARPVTP
ncbi:MAG: oligosaccharyl transferase, archaeosortase A system-associated [Haloarculaceae archaeon]